MSAAEISLRLHRCCELHGNIRSLSDAIGVPYRTLQDLVRPGLRQDIGVLVIAAIADATAVNVEWIVTGRGPMLRSDTPDASESPLVEQVRDAILRGDLDVALLSRLKRLKRPRRERRLGEPT